MHSAAQVVCIGPDDATVRRRAEAIGRDVDELVENGIAGTFEQARDRFGRLAEVGMARAYLQVLDLDRPRPPRRRARGAVRRLGVGSSHEHRRGQGP